MIRREHRRFRKRVDAWVDDEVDTVASRSIAMHIHNCWDCSSAAEMAKLIKGSLRRLADRQPPPLAAGRTPVR